MKKNIRIVLQYDGSRYDGWQKQGNTGDTIQEKLEKILEKMVGLAVEVQASGRTDAGVHAMGQVANFHIAWDGDAESVKEYLNQYLPEDIGVLEAQEVPERFHSRLNAVEKTYTYFIETASKKPVFERKYTYGLGQKLDVEQMRKAARQLIGEQDFTAFCSKKMKKSAVRTLNSIQIQENGSKVIIHYHADGFLYNMVRIMTGTLIEVGLGRRSPDSMGELLQKKDRQAAGFTAPPEGLFLMNVKYEQ